MSDIAVRVENLGKSYIIGHEKNQSYTTLRDVLTNKVRQIGHKTRQVFHKGQLIAGNELEEFQALKDINFEINVGDRLGIIGRNGAGKSTLLKLLSRITEPTKGKISIKGRVASLLEVGTGFHPELTGRENIYLNGAILGMTRAEVKRNFDEIVAFAEVDRFLDTPVKRYSSGMYVRLAFGVAAYLDTEVLIVDEVLAVGDAEFQKKCLAKMEDVGRVGRTVLFVSHNMIAVKSLCNRCLVLDKGTNVFLGDVSPAIDNYLSVKVDIPGELIWVDPLTAPGNHQARLNAIRIVSDGEVTGVPAVNKDIEIQIDYWNLEENGRRLISVHLFDSMNVLIFTTGNLKMASITPDPWVSKPYPVGLFRTTCVIPKYLLNTGLHTITLYINGVGAHDNIILQRNIISFDVQEEIALRSEYSGEWIGAIRPKLDWKTEQLQ